MDRVWEFSELVQEWGIRLIHTVHSNFDLFFPLSLYFTLFDKANAFINTIASFLNLKLMILFQFGTHGRKIQGESRFQREKFNKREGRGPN